MWMYVCSEVQVPTGGCFGLTRKGADKFVHEVVSQSDAAPARYPLRHYISYGYALAARATDEYDDNTAAELQWEYIHQPRHRTLVDFLRSFCREKNIDYDERFQANDDAWNDTCGRTSSNNSKRVRLAWYDLRTALLPPIVCHCRRYSCTAVARAHAQHTTII
jgi:hypothetical protein